MFSKEKIIHKIEQAKKSALAQSGNLFHRVKNIADRGLNTAQKMIAGASVGAVLLSACATPPTSPIDGPLQIPTEETGIAPEVHLGEPCTDERGTELQKGTDGCVTAVSIENSDPPIKASVIRRETENGIVFIGVYASVPDGQPAQVKGIFSSPLALKIKVTDKGCLSFDENHTPPRKNAMGELCGNLTSPGGKANYILGYAS